MSHLSDVESWMVRGEGIGAFADRLAQARYLLAWGEGDAGYVVSALERVFARGQRMPALNWLNCPDILSAIDLVEDAPRTLPEDWEDADFEVHHPTAGALHPSWLERGDAWDELLAATAREFVFLRGDQKIELAKRWRDQILEATWRRPVPLGALAVAATRALFLTSAASRSPSLQVVLPERDAIRDAAATLRARAETSLAAWRAVTQPRDDGARLLTMPNLRACRHVFQVDNLLNQCTSERTANLMTYLRCADAPST